MRFRSCWPAWTRVAVAAVAVAALAGVTPAAWAQDAMGPHGHSVMKDVMVPMRDGVRLATDIHLPTDANGAVLDEPLPTVLMRTPYSKEGGQSAATYFTSYGYAVVYQDTRGRYKSEGVWHMLNDDGPDGYDAVEWIARQPWSNGRIGMIGTSYVGGTQHAVALAQAPHLVTAIPVDAMSNLGYWSMRNYGAFELRFWNWIYNDAAHGSRQSRDPGTAAVLEDNWNNRWHYLVNLPLREGTTPLKFAPEYEDWLVNGMKHGGNDSYWTANAILDNTDQYKDIPVYLVGGWYDSWALNTSENFIALTKAIEGPVYLIMGPWIHGQQDEYAHGQVSFGEDAAIAEPLTWRREWYDRWLKEMDSAVGQADPFRTKVRIFVMGTGDERMTAEGYKNHGGYWRYENEWPLARTRYSNYYLHAGGALSTQAPTARNASTSFMFDPKNPVATIGGNISSGGGILLQGAWDQRGGEHVWNMPEEMPLSARNDVLVFQTEPLAQDMEVTGNITVKLWAASTALDTDLTAKLIDVHPPNADYPGGFDMNIADGIIRARYRDSRTEERLMDPGTVYEFEFRTYPTSNVFKRGHRIRVDITSSNFPRFDVNPNTGEPLNDNRRRMVATNTIYHDRDRPSHVVLPVIPIDRP